MGQSFATFTEVIKEWKGYEKFVKPFEENKVKYLEKTLKTYSKNKNEFGYNVLNHADFHIKNLLFKKNSEGKMEDFLFVSLIFYKI